jgi:hypothetical protein
MSDPEIVNEETAAATQPSSVDTARNKRRESVAKRKEREDREFFWLIVKSEAGRRFLHSILAEAHAFETRFGAAGPGGFPNDLATWLYFGEQQLGQRLYQTWHLKAPNEVMQMLRECEPKYMKVEI